MLNSGPINEVSFVLGATPKLVEAPGAAGATGTVRIGLLKISVGASTPTCSAVAAPALLMSEHATTEATASAFADNQNFAKTTKAAASAVASVAAAASLIAKVSSSIEAKAEASAAASLGRPSTGYAQCLADTSATAAIKSTRNKGGATASAVCVSGTAFKFEVSSAIEATAATSAIARIGSVKASSSIECGAVCESQLAVMREATSGMQASAITAASAALIDMLPAPADRTFVVPFEDRSFKVR